jgi:hypothetical protein
MMPIRFAGHRMVLIILLLLGGLPIPIALAQEKKPCVAFSMKVAQARVEEAIRRGEDFRETQRDLFYLAHITKPLALILDNKNDDWILVGESDPRSAELTLDDWVIALRARLMHPGRDPGVTIDPRPCRECSTTGNNAGCHHSKQQDVRFFAGIEQTRFGQVCYALVSGEHEGC